MCPTLINPRPILSCSETHMQLREFTKRVEGIYYLWVWVLIAMYISLCFDFGLGNVRHSYIIHIISLLPFSFSSSHDTHSDSNYDLFCSVCVCARLHEWPLLSPFSVAYVYMRFGLTTWDDSSGNGFPGVLFKGTGKGAVFLCCWLTACGRLSRKSSLLLRSTTFTQPIPYNSPNIGPHGSSGLELLIDLALHPSTGLQAGASHQVLVF